MREAIEADLAFTRPEDVIPEGDLGRARSLDPAALHDGEAFAHHRCSIADCSAPDGLVPDIKTHGFGHVDLTTIAGVTEVLEDVRQAGEVSRDQARHIRAALTGSTFPLAGGRRLRLLFIAPEGFIMRRGGPNGLRVTDSATAPGMNNHDAAVSVHADQDVTGTPLRQLLRGTAPWLFHHRSPSRNNQRSPLFLLNIWVPLQQVTRPLALMDITTLNRPAHQLRYGLETDAFLKRPDDQRVNDIWTFLHDPQQSWFFTSQASPSRAYIFQTLSTPHGAFILPGEDRAEQHYIRLSAARDAVRSADALALARLLAEPDPLTAESLTAPLSAAIAALEGALAVAARHGAALCAGEGRDAWETQVAAALDGVVRKSIEMRAVGLVTGGGSAAG